MSEGNSILDFQIFLKDIGDEQTTYLQWLMQAWGATLSLAVLAFAVALIAGSLMGVLRTTPNRLFVSIGAVWTELFRNIPLLVQVFLWYHVLPYIFPSLLNLPVSVLIIFALGFFTSARISEQVKAGIESLPRGQRYAGLAVGFTLPKTYQYILLPMAFRIVMPPLTSEAMNIVKNSSVAFAVGIVELTFYAQQAGEETSRNVQMYAVVTVLYFISAFLVNRIMAFIERRMQVPGMLMGGK